MKITRRRLRRLINEELNRLIEQESQQDIFGSLMDEFALEDEDAEGEQQTSEPEVDREQNHLSGAVKTAVLSQPGRSPFGTMSQPVEVLVDERGKLPAWVDVDAQVKRLKSDFPRATVHMGKAPWFEHVDADDAKVDALQTNIALVHVQLNPAEERLDLYTMMWTMGDDGNVVQHEGVYSSAQ